MTTAQLIIVALPSALSIIVILIGILINNSRMGDMNSRIGDMNARLGDMNTRIGDMNSRMADMRAELRGNISDLRAHMDRQFSHVDNRFDEARDTWRAELRRVEEVIDARLKHLEER